VHPRPGQRLQRSGEDFARRQRQAGAPRLRRDRHAYLADRAPRRRRRAQRHRRYTAAYLAARVGASFPGRINGSRFGLFITLEESGADGCADRQPAGDYYHHEEAQHRLIGRRSGRIYRLGDPVTVRLAEANPVTGGIILKIVEDDGAASIPAGPQTGGNGSRGRGGSPAGAKTGRGKAEGRQRGRR